MTTTMVPSPRPPSPAERGAALPGPPAPRRRRPALATFGTALVLCCAAELPLLRLLGRPGLHVMALAALPAGVAAGVTRAGFGRLSRRPGSPFPVVAGFAAGVVAGTLPGLLLGAADPFGPAALAPRLVDALRDGWRRLLSVPVPVPDTRSFTDLPVLLAAVLATVIVLVALSDRPAVALVPATVGFGGLLALGVHGPGSALLLAGCYVAAALLFLLVGARASGAARPGAAVVCVVTAVAAAIAGVAVTHGPPYDPRNTLRIPLNISVLQDPLALLPQRLETPRTPVLTAELPGALATHPRPWVALAYEDYDGAGWQVVGNARPAAAVLPAPGGTGAGSVTVALAGAGVLLPHPSSVTATVPEDLGYDPDADMLVSPRAIGRYSVEVSSTTPNVAALRDAATPAATTALSHVPSCAPAAVRQLAATAAQGSNRPYARAIRLQELLKAAPFRYEKAAPPGESCGSIRRFLTSHHGTSSQFATAFALAARLMGLPARVAAGYLPGRMDGHTETVTDADAYAWPQVLFSGTGWVNFYPVPRPGSAGATRVRQRHEPLPKQVSTPGSHNSKTGAPPRTAARHPAAGRPGTQLWVLLGVAVGALLLAWLTAVFLASAWRRRRRRGAHEPAARVLGAWDELLIPLRQAGVAVHGKSAPRVAQVAMAVIPGEQRTVGLLAVLAERALYDVTSERDADAAWQLSDRARPAAARAGGRRARLRRLLLPSRRRL